MSNTMKKFRSIISNAIRRAPRASLLLTFAAVIIHLFFSLRVQLLYDRSTLVHHELEVFEDGVRLELISKRDAETAASMILHDNAARLYGLI